MTTFDASLDRHASSGGDEGSGGGAASGGASGGRKPQRKRAERAENDELAEAMRLWAKKGRLTKSERLTALEAAKGMWKNRPEWKGMSSVQIVAELRRRNTRRGRDA